MSDEKQMLDFRIGEVVVDGQSLLYLLAQPENAAEEPLPLVLCLHAQASEEAAAEEADNFLKESSGAFAFAARSWQAKHPTFVLMPLCPAGLTWTSDKCETLLMAALDEVRREHAIDETRIYATGASMGGAGCWRLLSVYPDMFAGVIPISGAGIPRLAQAAKKVPIWACHAADDGHMPVSGMLAETEQYGVYGTRRMVSLVRGTGNTEVRYTEYPAGEMAKLGFAPEEAYKAAYTDTAAMEWLFAHNLKQRYNITCLMPGVWQIDDYFGAFFYIVEGTEKALVIDAGMGDNVLSLVRSLTRLPFELALTHVHYDHMNHSNQFGKFYLSKADLPWLPFYRTLMPQNTSTEADVIDIKDGDIIPLGGGYDVEVLALPGHSPGCMCFLDKKRGLCFTGDALGNGEFAWLQVPGSLPLSEHKRALEHFLSRLPAPGAEDIIFLGGHRRQEWNYPKHTRYNPIGRELIADMATLCGLILEGKVALGTSDISLTDDVTLTASHGTATIYFREENKR